LGRRVADFRIRVLVWKGPGGDVHVWRRLIVRRIRSGHDWIGFVVGERGSFSEEESMGSRRSSGQRFSGYMEMGRRYLVMDVVVRRVVYVAGSLVSYQSSEGVTEFVENTIR